MDMPRHEKCSIAREIISQLTKKSFDKIVNTAIMDCGARGVHSLLLVNTPAQRVRLIYTDEDHVLWKNDPQWYRVKGMSIGFHPHHCDLTIKVILGKIVNWVIKEIDWMAMNSFRLDRYLYKSRILTDSDIGFTFSKKDVQFITKRLGIYREGATISLDATDIHTVAGYEKQEAAWLIIEGEEDENYKPYCYSTQPLEKMCFDGLYRPATADEVRNIIDRVL